MVAGRVRGDAGKVRAQTVLVALGVVAVLAFVFAVVGTEWWAQDAPLDTFDPAGPAARTIMDLVTPVFVVAGLIFLLVEGLIVFIAWRFRDRSGEESEPSSGSSSLPRQTHGHNLLELGWTTIPFLILLGVAVGSVATIFRLEDREPDALRVKVVGQQWWWSYEYDLDGDGFSPDDENPEVVTANELVIPARRQVDLTITSADVIHSFWIPRLNGKKDAVPGRLTSLSLEADEPGRYRGQCTEFCGLSHSRMQMYVVALEEDDFRTWLEKQRDPNAPDERSMTPAQRRGLEVFQSNCTSCHRIAGVNGEDYKGAAQVSGTAPDLTHLMSRDSFAGSIFYLWEGIDSWSGVENYLTKEGLRLNRGALESWLRNPPGMKPMAPDPDRGSRFGRGMPNLGLSEQQIDDLVAYLTTLD
ncbi:MAG: cytochrome c oxidase subunit 2 [Acidimicrobiales bacterium]|nr:MAG: cytochrome c oxidase subunit 2 [Acidimicrobiales bacterium]